MPRCALVMTLADWSQLAVDFQAGDSKIRKSGILRTSVGTPAIARNVLVLG